MIPYSQPLHMRIPSQDMESSLAIHDRNNQNSMADIRARLFDTNNNLKPLTASSFPEIDESFLNLSPFKQITNSSSKYSNNPNPGSASKAPQTTINKYKSFKVGTGSDSGVKRVTETYVSNISINLNEGQPKENNITNSYQSRSSNLLPPAHPSTFLSMIPAPSESAVLQKQNEFLRNELARLEKSFNERVKYEVSKYQAEAEKRQQQKIHQEIEIHRRLINSQNDKETEQLRLKLDHYERYIDTLERANSTALKELERAKNEAAQCGQLKQMFEKVTAEKHNLEEILKHKEGELTTTLSRLHNATQESQNKSSSYYMQELERANVFLKKENKRLSQLVVDRTRRAFG